MTLALMKIAAGNSIVFVAGHTFAEFYRGGTRTAREARLVNTWRPEVISITIDEGKFAGELLAGTGERNSMDALVIACAALHRMTAVYTSDPDDLTALRNALRPTVHRIDIVDVR